MVRTNRGSRETNLAAKLTRCRPRLVGNKMEGSMMDDQAVRNLVASGVLTDSQARVAVRASCKCEYCGLNFLACIENYHQWEWDHIIPKFHGGSEDEENIA